MTMQDGKIIHVDMERETGFPTEWCTFTRGRIVPEVCGHADRLKYPQKRLGARGEGRWARISWDEALDTIAGRLSSYKDQFGPESVAICLGEPKGMETAFAHRFASTFGTPNVATPGNY
jgi:anaerobic selenocysteine-containing dehydrogenase